MLGDVSHESALRVLDVRFFLRSIRLLADAQDTVAQNIVVKRTTVAMKGLFFVYLYGVWEHTVSAAVQRTLAILGSRNHVPSDFRHALLSVVLDKKCTALADVGSSKTFRKRRELFAELSTAEPADIDDTALSRIPGNLAYRQLSEIWECLCVDCPVLPDQRFRMMLEEMVENRRRIAHGRETPSMVGRNYTLAELEAKLDGMHEVCVHILSALDGYLQGERYLA